MLPNINLFHLTLLVALLFVGWPRPLPTGPTHSTGGGGAGYHCSIVSSTYHYISYFALRYLIWSSFQYLSNSDLNMWLISAYMLLLLEINFLHLILPVALLLAGWPPPLPRTHPFHRGEGGWCYDHDHGRGGGGGTRNLEHIWTGHTEKPEWSICDII